MIKHLTHHLNYGSYAEIALVIFALVFVAVVARTLATKREITQQQANIVLGDQQETAQ